MWYTQSVNFLSNSLWNAAYNELYITILIKAKRLLHISASKLGEIIPVDITGYFIHNIILCFGDIATNYIQS